MWVRSDTKTARGQSRSRSIAATVRSDSSVVRPLVLDEDRVGRHALRRSRSRRPASASVVLSPGTLPPVMTSAGARPSSNRSIAWSRRASVDRRGDPVVLGRAEDDDRVGRAAVVAVALVPDPPRRVGEDDERAGRHGQRETGEVLQHVRPWPGRRPLLDLSDRDTSCTSGPSRSSTGRCGRSGRRSG